MVVATRHVIGGVVSNRLGHVMIRIVICSYREITERHMFVLGRCTRRMLDIIDGAGQVRRGEDQRQDDGKQQAKPIDSRRVDCHGPFATAHLYLVQADWRRGLPAGPRPLCVGIGPKQIVVFLHQPPE